MLRLPRAFNDVEVRVLGALLEKEQTTPEIYPLSVNSLVHACNQKTGREPVMELSEGAVHGALRELSREGFTERLEGARVTRWRHAVDQRWDLSAPRKAAMTLLLLRGPQTPGELRNRCERMHSFASVAEMEATLNSLAADEEGLVRELPRAPGQKESRWVHLLANAASVPAQEPSAAIRRYAADEGEDLVTRVGDLNRRVRELERLVGILVSTPPSDFTKS